MSDTLTNALQQSAHNSTVLQGIMNPAQVNPLAGTGSAITAVSGMQGLAAKQGEQLVGQALQQATDPDSGVVDTQKAQKIAAGMGPSAAYAMQDFLKTGSQLRGEQIIQAGNLYGVAGRLAASAAGDPSDANMAKIRAQGVALGLPASGLAEIDRIAALPVEQRPAEALKHTLGAIDALQRMHYQQGGVPATWETGGAIQGGTYDPVTGALRPAGAPVAKTLTPEGAMTGGIQYPATAEDVKAGRAASIGAPVFVSGPDVITRFGLGGILPPGARVVGGGGGGGVVGADGKPVSPSNPPRLLNVPGQPPAPPAPAGAPQTAPAPGGPQGIGAAIQALPAAPSASSLPVPPIPPASPPPGPRSDLGGGVQVASANPLQAPTVGAAAPPSPLVPGDVNAIMAGMNRARATRTAGTQTAYNTFSVGPGTEEAQGYKTSADKLSADDLAATEWQSTKLPYVEALKNYGEGTKTGPTTDFWNQVAGTIRTPLAKIGINVGPLADTTERVDALGKWLASIQSNNPVSAKSDAELAQVLKGSASTHINEVAGEDMVKAGFTLRRMGTALNQDWHNNPALQQQYGTYLRYLGDMNNKIDPRAFSVDMLNPSQKQRLVAAIKNGSDADAERFEASLALARRTRQVP